VLTCGVFRTIAGLEVRCGYGEDDLTRSHYTREVRNRSRGCLWLEEGGAQEGLFGSKEHKAEDSEEPGDCQPAFLELSCWCALPNIIRVTGSSAFFGSIHQQRHVAQRKKSTRGEYRMSARFKTLTLRHSGQRVRANAIKGDFAHSWDGKAVILPHLRDWRRSTFVSCWRTRTSLMHSGRSIALPVRALRFKRPSGA
jgi:hypothetical protein